MKKVINRILEFINSEKIELDSFLDPFYRQEVILSKDKLIDFSSDFSLGKTFFVDGGSSIILETGSYCVSYIKLAGVLFQDEKFVSQQIYTFFVHIDRNEDNNVKLFSEDDFSFLKKEYSIKGEELIEILNKFRRIAELSLANHLNNEINCIVIDGSLQSGKEDINLISKLESSGTLLIGVSKSCSLLTGTKLGIIDLLSSFKVSGKWMVSGATNYPKLLFGKLNSNSKNIFRIDFVNGLAQEVCSGLSKYSNDAVFPGYPYGLIRADAIARVSNEEKNILRAMFSTKVYLDELELASNAHSKLESIGF
jgi:hypothetical protein